ncbi:MAG: hypothetical protein HY763_01560 [Planctomycetes bacterium]|nr:hypothetical protein [Planctomycetota bacterium]
MISDQLRELLRREPFKPFRLVLSSGRHYDVRNPELVVPMRSEVFIAFPDGDRWTHLPYLHIAAIEAVPNGGQRKRRSRG